MDINQIEEELFRLIDAGRVDETRALFTKHPEYLEHQYRNAISWLAIAVGAGKRATIELLLELGSDVNIGKKTSDETPLWIALTEDNPSIVEILLRRGADPNRGRYVITAITGMKIHSLEMVKLLEEHGADLHRNYMNELTNQPMNALSTAVDWGKDDVAEYLRSKGAVMPGTGKPAASSKKK